MPLALLDASYGHLRRYAPTPLDTFAFAFAFAFAGAPPSQALLEALVLLRRLNASGRKRVPREAPTAFVTPRRAPHVYCSSPCSWCGVTAPNLERELQ